MNSDSNESEPPAELLDHPATAPELFDPPEVIVR